MHRISLEDIYRLLIHSKHFIFSIAFCKKCKEIALQIRLLENV